MATDVERLVVSLEASITKYERAMQRALGQTNATTRRIESRFAAMNRRLESGFVAFGRVAAGAFAGAAVLRGAQQLVDAGTRIENSLKVTGLAGAELEQVYARLFDSAQRNMAPLETLATLYSRLGLAQSQLGVSNEELLQFTDKVALALRVQGTTADEARGALIQLSQAVGGGIVRAEEFNSIVEGAPSILRAAALGLEEAEGSVAKLRRIVIDGKLSSEAFFRAFLAGSQILEEQVANAEITVSQGFVRLQNVLIDAATRFNDTTGAGQEFAQFLSDLGTKIDELSRSDAFNNLISGADEFGEALARGTMRELELIEQAIKSVERSLDEAFENTDVPDFALQLAQAEQAMVNLAQNTKGVFGPEVEAAFQDMIQQLLEGKGSAELADEAIMALGEVDPSFANLQSKISEIVGEFLRLRDAAVAANAAAVSAAVAPRGPQGRGRPVLAGATPQSSGIEPVSLDDYPIDPGGSGSSKKSPAQRFAEALEQQRREIENLREKTALQASLNPLVNDYGFAIEKLRVQQELENEATRAGLELTPQRKAAIEELATGYANATVEAERLAEAQEYAQQTMADFSDLAKSSLRGFIDDLREGKDASEALGNALGKIGDKLLDMSLNLLFGGGPGGFNILSIFGFAKGGIASHGRPLKRFAGGGVSNSAAIFGEAGPEAAVPLPDGRRIPVELRMPSLAAAGGATALTVHVVSDDEKFSAFVTNKAGQVVAQSAPAIVATSVGQANKSAPGALAQYQQQRAGGDYRT